MFQLNLAVTSFRFLSERETADRNYALGYYMNAHKVKKNYNNIKISIVVSLLVLVHLSLSLWLGYGGWSKVVVLLHSQVTSPTLPVGPPITSKMQWFLTCWGLRWGTGMFTLFAREQDQQLFWPMLLESVLSYES